jgi:methionyl aminopeptidase
VAKIVPIYNTAEERDALRAAGRFNAQMMDFIRTEVREGISTDEINRLIHEYTLDHGHTPACLGYSGFPKSVCTSINEVVCHGIPDHTVLKDGDIVNVDLTTIVDGWYGDQSEMFMIGDVSDEAQRLVQAALEALFVGIRAIKDGGKVFDIGKAIYKFAKRGGYSVVREYQGHGIGREFHQEPGVPHFPDSAAARVILEPGACFTIEPMLNIGTWRTHLDRSDGWTVRTADGKLSAQWEHTILVTEDGPEILTLTKNGPGDPGSIS